MGKNLLPGGHEAIRKHTAYERLPSPIPETTTIYPASTMNLAADEEPAASAATNLVSVHTDLPLSRFLNMSSSQIKHGEPELVEKGTPDLGIVRNYGRILDLNQDDDQDCGRQVRIS